MIFNDQQYQERLTRLNQLRVVLVPTIDDATISYLFAKLGEVQDQRDRANTALMEAFKNRAEAKAILLDSTAELDMQMATLLATDENVKAQKTAEMRTSLAETKCADIAMRKHNALLDSVRADSYFDAVNVVVENLKTTNAILDQQVDLVRMYIDGNATLRENFSKKPS